VGSNPAGRAKVPKGLRKAALFLEVAEILDAKGAEKRVL
jgi:hypothetical protein